jgi:murein L,D-transpeptidase YafK
MVCLLGTVVGHATAGEFQRQQLAYPRVRAAFAAHEAGLRTQFESAGASWPPRDLLFRVFKADAALETWARARSGDTLVLVRSDPICASSGWLGPKRTAGDGQVPEGFYEVAGFNPTSHYHLALRVSYPNASDRILGRAPLGGDVMIHGDCVTIGCIPMTDPVIEQLYAGAVAARDAGQERIQVQIFPARFPRDGLGPLLQLAGTPDIRRFWANLQQGDRRFRSARRPLEFRVDGSGSYVFR